jgi:hypothetical protein
MTVREFYLNEYPTEQLGPYLSETATWEGLLLTLQQGGNVYEYLNVWDGTVREELFQELANQQNVSYSYLNELWWNTPW